MIEPPNPSPESRPRQDRDEAIGEAGEKGG